MQFSHLFSHGSLAFWELSVRNFFPESEKSAERHRRNRRKLLSWHQQFARRQPWAINSFKWGALLKADKWNHSPEVRLLSHVADYWVLCHPQHFALGLEFIFFNLFFFADVPMYVSHFLCCRPMYLFMRVHTKMTVLARPRISLSLPPCSSRQQQDTGGGGYRADCACHYSIINPKTVFKELAATSKYPL